MNTKSFALALLPALLIAGVALPVGASDYNYKSAVHTPYYLQTARISNTWGIPGAGHPGGPAVDFVLPAGWNVRSAGPGVVVASYREDCGGNVVGVYHPVSNRTAFYAHLSRRKVSVGQPVSRGESIGLSGQTGSCIKGAHLHYQETSGKNTRSWSGPRVDPGSINYCIGNSPNHWKSLKYSMGKYLRNDGFNCY